jgi:hypothetical protein
LSLGEYEVLKLFFENHGYVDKEAFYGMPEEDGNALFSAVRALETKLLSAGVPEIKTGGLVIAHSQGGYSLFQPNRVRSLWRKTRKHAEKFELGKSGLSIVELDGLTSWGEGRALMQVRYGKRNMVVELSRTELMVVRTFQELGIENGIIPSRDLVGSKYFPEDKVHLFKAFYKQLWTKLHSHRFASDRLGAKSFEELIHVNEGRGRIYSYHWFFE